MKKLHTGLIIFMLVMIVILTFASAHLRFRVDELERHPIQYHQLKGGD